MIFLIIILLYPVICGTTLLILNDKCLIPGTRNYSNRQLEKRLLIETEAARAAAVQSRYRAAENLHLDQVRQLQIEAAK